MCLQTTLESVNGQGTLDGDGERVPEGRGGMRKAMFGINIHDATLHHQATMSYRIQI